MPRAGVKCVPHGSSAVVCVRRPPVRTPMRPLVGYSGGDPRPGLPGLGGSGRMCKHAPAVRV